MHQQGLTVMGLLTGFMITTLVLILGSPGIFQIGVGPIPGNVFFEILATYIALVAAMGIIGMMALLEVGAGLSKMGSRVDQFGYACFVLCLCGFTGALPLLLAPFTHVGAGIVLAAAVLLFVLYLAFGGFGRSGRS